MKLLARVELDDLAIAIFTLQRNPNPRTIENSRFKLPFLHTAFGEVRFSEVLEKKMP